MSLFKSINSLYISARHMVNNPVSMTLLTTERATLIKMQFASVQERSPENSTLDDLYKKYIAALSTSNWQIIGKKEWRLLPWLLWDTDKPLIHEKILVDKYLEVIDRSTSTRPLKTLIYVYLRSYPLSINDGGTISRFIINKLNYHTKGVLDEWRIRQQRYSIISGLHDNNTITSYIINNNNSVNNSLDSLGLSSELALIGMSKEIYKDVLKYLLNSDPYSINQRLLKRIIEWSLLSNRLRFPDLRTLLINSLLQPWVDIDPNDEIKDLLLEFLLESIGDPRIDIGKWQGVNDSSQIVIRKWLVKETLEDFFKILDKTAVDSHWRYRKQFWISYYNKDAINDAWIALGPEALHYAINAFGNRFNAAILDGNIQANHSVLLLKIGDLIIAEWSHNGRCRAWFAYDDQSPKLNQRKYFAYQLREHSNQIVEDYQQPGIPHLSSETGGWQGRLATYINNYTGVYVSHGEYMNGH